MMRAYILLFLCAHGIPFPRAFALDAPTLLDAAVAFEETPLTWPFFSGDCPAPFSCDGSCAWGPWQIHDDRPSCGGILPFANAKDLDVQRQLARKLPCGAWSTCERAREITRAWTAKYPPPEDMLQRD